MTNEDLLRAIEEAKKSETTSLTLQGKGIETLPPELFQLTTLIRLNLSLNNLIEIPPAISQLTSLTELYMGGNELTSLPPEICQLTKLKKLEIKGNPLASPPIEIAEQGIETIREYFNTLKEEDQPVNDVKTILTGKGGAGASKTSLPCGEGEVFELREDGNSIQKLNNIDKQIKEVKFLLVGEGAAGKTSLVKQLFDEDFDPNEDTTHGINIRNWKVVENGDEPLRVNIWDFGGQEIMHATHQFFLSRRSLYVLVLDGRRDERPEYWLRHIESFGGNSPVLVVLNKHDSNPSFDVNRPFLMRKYPAIKGFFRISCANGMGIARFRKTLLKELAQVEMIGIRWPGSWFQVKERIEDLDRPYISSEEYCDLCAEAGITEQQSREILVDFLHDLGAAVHFSDFILKAMHVLDPVWVTEAVYKIINAEQVADARGTLVLNTLGNILPYAKNEKLSWPEATHVFILELMKKFELCWGIGEQAVLIPQLLPVAEPELTFDYTNALGFVLHYRDFLPPSVMPRFLVKRHSQIKKGLCWRTGVVLKDKASNTEAVVKADHEARSIYLWTHGPRRKEFLTFLWFSLRAINDSFERLRISERIPMPDDPTVTADYQTLLDNVKDGIERYRPDGAKRAYNVHELLGLVEPSGKDEQMELLRMIKAQLDEKDSGVGVNLNELFARVLGREKQKYRQKR